MLPAVVARAGPENAIIATSPIIANGTTLLTLCRKEMPVMCCAPVMGWEHSLQAGRGAGEKE
ncbi:hypothetical protein GCM10027214_24660 [Stenotrophomonas tumulicola]